MDTYDTSKQVQLSDGTIIHESNDLPDIVDSLKKLAALIAGIAISNAVLSFVTATSHLSKFTVHPYPTSVTIVFILQILNSVRFYHGNIRHLDSTYKPSMARSGVETNKLQSSRTVAIDFFVILFQLIVFGLMSFFIERPVLWLISFFLLLLVDIAWLGFFHQSADSESEATNQKKWLINNGAHFAVAALLFACAKVYSVPKDNSWLLYTFLFLAFVNTITDFSLSKRLYFGSFYLRRRGELIPMRQSKRSELIFVGAPMSNRFIDNEDQHLKDSIETLITELRRCGFRVFSAHIREGTFGGTKEEPAAAIRDDINGLNEASSVVLFVDQKTSFGVGFELGYARAKGKRVCVIKDKGCESPFVWRGLVTSGSENFAEFDLRGGFEKLVVSHIAHKS